MNCCCVGNKRRRDRLPCGSIDGHLQLHVGITPALSMGQHKTWERLPRRECCTCPPLQKGVGGFFSRFCPPGGAWAVPPCGGRVAHAACAGGFIRRCRPPFHKIPPPAKPGYSLYEREMGVPHILRGGDLSVAAVPLSKNPSPRQAGALPLSRQMAGGDWAEGFIRRCRPPGGAWAVPPCGGRVAHAACAGGFTRSCIAPAIAVALLFLATPVRADETNVIVTAYTNTTADGALRITTHVATNIVGEWDLMMQGKVLWGAAAGDSLPALFNRAEHQRNHGFCQRVLALLKHIEQRFGEKDLREFQRDGCSGQFLLEAGFCRVYRQSGAQETNLMLAYNYGMRARKRMLEGSGGGNARRYALLLWDLSMLPEHVPGQGKEFTELAVALHPGLPPEMIIVRESMAKGIQGEGNLKGAADAYAKLLTDCPYYQAITYAACGRMFALLGDYHSAFEWWTRGLKNMQPIEFYSCAQDIPREVYEWFAFASEDEIRAYQEAVRRVAARFPATTRNVAEIAQWLQFADDRRVQFELDVRAAERAHDVSALSNLWRQAVSQYSNPWYALHAGDYAAWTRIWCNRMQNENWPYLTQIAEPCAAERIEKYRDKLDTDSLRLYRDTLQRRADQFRTHPSPRTQDRVTKIDARCKELDKLLNPALTTNAVTNAIE